MWLQSIFLLIFVKAVAGFNPPWMFMGRPLSGFRQFTIPDDKKIELDALPELNCSFFEQKLDHFTYEPFETTSKWQQRYWYNGKYSKPNGPQFLILGGEAPAVAYDILYDKFPHVQYSKFHNAGLWLLEHRFYGESQPYETLDTVHLDYLTSKQALGDIAAFISTQNKNLFTNDTKWILFGGAYAGNLALWFRELYPNLCDGAVASSAPIQPNLDFYEYLPFAQELIRSIDPACVKNLLTAFKDFTDHFTWKNGRHMLSNSFGWTGHVDALTDDSVSYENMAYIYSTIVSYFQASIQYNESISNFIADIMGRLGMPKMDNVYSNLITYLQFTGTDDPLQASTRAWTWQACNEFGYFPSTNAGRSAFSNQISVNFYINLCTDVFGADYNLVTIQQGISQTLKRYGGNQNYKGTNVIASRGSLDPWSILALQESNNETVFPYLIEGVGHCADMVPIDTKANNTILVKYMIDVQTNISAWLED